MNFPSIRIEGAILSPDILDRLEDAPGQRPSDFDFDASTKVKDEIARAWADAQDYWRIFQRKLEALKADSPATTETRNNWIVPLLGLLGYQLEYQARGTEVNGKNYPISHRVTNRGHTAIHIVGARDPAGLDQRRMPQVSTSLPPSSSTLPPSSFILHTSPRSASSPTSSFILPNSPRMSAHALVQEYLNLTDQLYGLVTNGRMLRLLRDSSRLVKLTYLEFDLDRIFADGLFADFAVLFRLLHASRLPQTVETSSTYWLERYHQETIEQGTRIREGLRVSVTEALEILGSGFLAHPDNTALRQQVSSGQLRPDVYFNHLLRLVYRLLFLMVIEERGLVFPRGVPSKSVSLYFQHYSVQRLRRLTVTRGLKVERFHDAWLSLLSTFQLFEQPATSAQLGTTALGGQLFNPESLGPLTACRLSNAALFTALDRLCYFNHRQSGQRMPVNFGALATEEFGSVYESLLELHPIVETEPTPCFGFRQAAGNERKTSGSYYTPVSLVDCLLDSALDPVIDERIRNFAALGFKSAEEAILALKVCDPACGSGHFLIAAAQRIARRLAILRAGDEEPGPELLRHTLREVIGHCIHGVDINPMSVELCKVGLWLEAVEPGKPLNFLDHHIKCGNSLLGASPAAIKDGIPDKAYEPITGDTREAAGWMKKLNKDARAGQTSFDFSQAQPWERLGNLPAAVAKLETLDDETPEALVAKEKLYREIVEGSGYENARLLHDTWCAAFVWPKHSTDYGTELTTEHLRKIERNPHSVAPGLKVKVRDLARQYRFFHWHLEFPAVFGADGKGGFDVVLGNPPWERVKLQEKEWFATRRPDIANAANAATRRRMIEALRTEDPALHVAFLEDRRQTEGESHFVRNGGRYPLCGRGDINTYTIFAETNRLILGPTGRVGCIVPSGIATDDTTKLFFRDLIESRSLASLYDFENREGLFPAVDSRMKFCLLTLAGSARPVKHGADFVFFAHRVDDLHEEACHFTLTAEDLALLNPNTRTCPVFRSKRDAELTGAIYRRVPVLSDELLKGRNRQNQWHVTLFTMMHSAGAAHLFLDESYLSSIGASQDGARWVLNDRCFLALYEGKMFHQFDHRFASVEITDNVARPAQSIESTSQNHADPSWPPTPRAWVDETEIEGHCPGVIETRWFLGFKDVTAATNERTLLAAILPRSAIVDSVNLIGIGSPCAGQSAALLVGNLNSFVLDYIVRQKVGGNHIKFYLLNQLPVLPPLTYDQSFPWPPTADRRPLKSWLSPRVLELTYTAWDLEPFAKDCGYDGPPFRWDEERRFLLRCELDAAFFHLYGIARDDVDYIMETFPIVKRKDEQKYGECRTKRVILEIYDAMAEAIRTREPYRTLLDPPPADPCVAHPAWKVVSEGARK